MAGRYCAFSGCPNRVERGYCDKHQPVKPSHAGGSNPYNTARWRRERREHLSQHPLCVECQKDGRVTVATHVDHVIPHRGSDALMWDRSNWQSLCITHANRKTGLGR